MESFVSALAQASRRNVDAIVIPGSLWDHSTIRGQTAGTVLEAIEELKSIPVFILPGDMDPYTEDSYFNNKFLRARGMREWPSNAYIFREPHFTTIKHPHRPDVAFTGIAHTSQQPITQRLLSTYVSRDEEALINILLFHGSLDSYPGIDGLAPERISAPFSVEELAAQRFNYAAIGHFHEYTELCDEYDNVIGAYSGCLVGRNFEEIGPRVAIIVNVTVNDDGTSVVVLEPIEVASNRLCYVVVDVSGLDAEALQDEIAYGVQEQEIRPDVDIVCISLEGTHPAELDPVSIAERLRPDFYNLLIVDRTRPDYLSEEYDERTTEHKFLQSMIEQQRRAEEKRAQNPKAQSRTDLPSMLISGKTIEDALYYGLDALKGRKVTIRHVD